ncbi:reprolysin-like metallopeptidase [Flaviaesturariibacter flavus]|uniref:reprolysin-like metallopeptidase n=1 Tax=Flaviaesturariibacter flavus TaxID=2502780 RepID=UPI001404567C|nr:zinc-dependent metalloprotease family protein [Flaviaesturariibacter flavus]
MRKLLFAGLFVVLAITGQAQDKNPWRAHTGSEPIVPDKGATRPSFPKVFELFALDQAALRSELFKVVGNAVSHSTQIVLPNADGAFETFEVVEGSNFEPALQARFPEIRAFSGRSLSDPGATLKLSYSPQGVQGMVFRTGSDNEFLEAYSQDHTVYAVFRARHDRSGSQWNCSTTEQEITDGLNRQVFRALPTARSGGNLKTLRLAQSVTAEYSNFFGATSAAQVGLVLAAVNATLTRCNGVYEKDLALHLNLINSTTNVFYYDAATDPYANAATGAGGTWNGQLQTTLTANIGDANYDIGHLFGASGGGGNAGCIGCICTAGTKGRGFTSPANNIPQGDDFDIDYVVHEVGHQLGANHTFSHSLEGSGQNKEVGSGITIMGYAGITSRDVAPHSIDIYHATSIEQIQANLNVRTCPVTVAIANATPVVASVNDYTIPMSTPFALTGTATDADGDPLTYCWEQNDEALNGQSGSSSIASATKLTGPNWISFSPTASGTRLFPKLATILNGGLVSGPLAGGDAGTNSEALSSVARTLSFRLTVRDNAPYSSTAPVKVGQTSLTDMYVTVTTTSGPFAVTVPNSALSWAGASTQTVTWNVANSTAPPVNCANVRILLSTDGGITFPTVLVASTANDGSETVTLPAVSTTTARIKVESIGNIFFDISNADFTITNASCAAAVTTQPLAASVCPGGNASFTVAASGSSLVYQWQVSTDGGTTFNNISGATGDVYSFAAAAGQNGYRYRCVVTGGCGSAATSGAATLQVTSATTVSAGPANLTVCSGAPGSFTASANGGSLGYQWQMSSNGGTTFTDITGATAATYNFNAAAAQNGNLFRCVVSSTCFAPVITAAAQLTVNAATTVSTQPQDAMLCAGGNSGFTVAVTGNSLSYQWQVSTDGGASYANVSNSGVYNGAASNQLSLTGVASGLNNYRYRCVVGSNCPSITSGVALLTVNTAPALVTDASSTIVCAGQPAGFGLNVSGTALTYQWQVSTDSGSTYTNIANGGVYSGTTAAALQLGTTQASQNGSLYRCVVAGTCSPGLTSAGKRLTVNTPVALSTQPVSAAICAGQGASFAVVATGTAPAYQWQVSTGGGGFTNVAGANNASLPLNNVAASMNANTYRCIITGAAPCGSLQSSVVTLTVNPVPVVSLQAAPFQSLYPGISTTLSATSTPSSVTYQWSRNGVALAATGNTVPVSIDAVGSYNVRATDAIGCTSLSNTVTISDSAMAQLFIYPNPNNGVFQVRYFNTPGQAKARMLAVYDAKGALVSARTYTVTGMYDRMDVTLNGVSRGMYVVALLDESGRRLATGKVSVR